MGQISIVMDNDTSLLASYSSEPILNVLAWSTLLEVNFKLL